MGATSLMHCKFVTAPVMAISNLLGARSRLTHACSPRSARPLQVPIGLVSSNWGGTIIQSWSDNSTNKLCAAEDAAVAKQAPRNALDFVAPGFEEAVGAGPDPNTGYGVLFNAMINPFAVGPMTISSFIWFQGASRNYTKKGGGVPPLHCRARHPHPHPPHTHARAQARATTATRNTAAVRAR